MGKVHVLSKEERFHNLRSVDGEVQMFVDYDENQSAGGGNARDPSDEARSPPPPIEVDHLRDKADDLPIYEGEVNLTEFAH